ncbi:hypothetical protein HYC85_022130 [Camellia sinensis]|uniref:RING-type domain-containing protein n=1 Tax=Camellia sinensis TaxID=4442 RepID=A0A7J7GJI9_CAMSI|nr:hypothetical protein HYC85_022130 [Camellia sinensis]
MEEQDRPSSAQASSSSSSTGREFSGDAATSSSAFPVREAAAAEEAEHHDRTRQQNGVSYHVHYPTEEAREISPLLREDAWSCMIVVFTFWFFGSSSLSMTLILGVYGSVNLQLGPNSSLLITPNTLFVESTTMRQRMGLFYMDFTKSHRPDVELTWSQTHNTSLPSGFQKASSFSLSYDIDIQGMDIYVKYGISNQYFIQRELPESILYNPYNCPSTSFQCYGAFIYPHSGFDYGVKALLNGSRTHHILIAPYHGTLLMDIWTSASYYVAVGNLNSEEVEVQLNLKVKAILYNTTEAYYNCAVARGTCNLKMLFPSGNAVVLTSPGPEQGTNVWQVQLSYGPRWLTYLVGIGGLTLLVLSAFYMFNNFQCTREEGTRFQFGEMRSERAPLLQKDDDLSSWGSSCDSVSQDDEDLEDELALGSLEGMPLKDGEYNNNIRRLCAICFDAPRDCFFLPCGHCVACFACGTRIAELTGTCPICRRNIKKVRRIFTGSKVLISYSK